MGIFLWIVFGALVGWIASIIMKTRRRGLIRNIIVGLIGAVIGGWIGSLFGIGSVGDFSLESILLATLGAVVLIAVLKRV